MKSSEAQEAEENWKGLAEDTIENFGGDATNRTNEVTNDNKKEEEAPITNDNQESTEPIANNDESASKTND